MSVILGFMYFWSGTHKINPFMRDVLAFYRLLPEHVRGVRAISAWDWTPIVLAAVGEAGVGLTFLVDILVQRITSLGPRTQIWWMYFRRLVALSVIGMHLMISVHLAQKLPVFIDGRNEDVYWNTPVVVWNAYQILLIATIFFSSSTSAAHSTASAKNKFHLAALVVLTFVPGLLYCINASYSHAYLSYDLYTGNVNKAVLCKPCFTSQF